MAAQQNEALIWSFAILTTMELSVQCVHYIHPSHPCGFCEIIHLTIYAVAVEKNPLKSTSLESSVWASDKEAKKVQAIIPCVVRPIFINFFQLTDCYIIEQKIYGCPLPEICP